MEYKHIVRLDLTDCKYLGELHQRIKEAFEFPDYYGENWDAFYDLMRMESTADKVIIIGRSSARQSLQGSIDKMIATLEDTKRYLAKYGDILDYEMVDEVINE